MFRNLFKAVSSWFAERFSPFRRVYETLKSYISPGEIVKTYRIYREAREEKAMRPFIRSLPGDVTIPRSLMVRTPDRLQERYQYIFETGVDLLTGEYREGVKYSVLSSQRMTKAEALAALMDVLSSKENYTIQDFDPDEFDLVEVKRTIW